MRIWNYSRDFFPFYWISGDAGVPTIFRCNTVAIVAWGYAILYLASR